MMESATVFENRCATYSVRQIEPVAFPSVRQFHYDMHFWVDLITVACYFLGLKRAREILLQYEPECH
jgi:hypothetical protein